MPFGVTNILLKWTDFKAAIESRRLQANIRAVQTDTGGYHVVADDGLFSLECLILAEDSADKADFEATYLALSGLIKITVKPK